MAREPSPTSFTQVPVSLPQQRQSTNAFTGKETYESLLALVDRCVAQYQLLDHPSERVIVALSGGKDSLLLARCLVDLGIDVTPIVIDMGYEHGWSDRIRTLSEAIGLAVHIIEVRDRKRSPI